MKDKVVRCVNADPALGGCCGLSGINQIEN